MRWNELIQQVRVSGQYATDPEAERVLRTVLTVLGAHITGDERRALTRCLPVEAACILARQTPAAQALTAPQFVDAVAARLGDLTPPAARWGWAPCSASSRTVRGTTSPGGSPPSSPGVTPSFSAAPNWRRRPESRARPPGMPLSDPCRADAYGRTLAV